MTQARSPFGRLFHSLADFDVHLTFIFAVPGGVSRKQPAVRGELAVHAAIHGTELPVVFIGILGVSCTDWRDPSSRVGM